MNSRAPEQELQADWGGSDLAGAGSLMDQSLVSAKGIEDGGLRIEDGAAWRCAILNPLSSILAFSPCAILDPLSSILKFEVRYRAPSNQLIRASVLRMYSMLFRAIVCGSGL